MTTALIFLTAQEFAAVRRRGSQTAGYDEVMKYIISKLIGCSLKFNVETDCHNASVCF